MKYVTRVMMKNSFLNLYANQTLYNFHVFLGCYPRVKISTILTRGEQPKKHEKPAKESFHIQARGSQKREAQGNRPVCPMVNPALVLVGASLPVYIFCTLTASSTLTPEPILAATGLWVPEEVNGWNCVNHTSGTSVTETLNIKLLSYQIMADAGDCCHLPGWELPTR